MLFIGTDRHLSYWICKCIKYFNGNLNQWHPPYRKAWNKIAVFKTDWFYHTGTHLWLISVILIANGKYCFLTNKPDSSSSWRTNKIDALPDSAQMWVFAWKCPSKVLVEVVPDRCSWVCLLRVRGVSLMCTPDLGIYVNYLFLRQWIESKTNGSLLIYFYFFGDCGQQFIQYNYVHYNQHMPLHCQ